MADLTFMLVRPTPQTSRRIRTKEAALYLAVSEKKLRRLVRVGNVPVHPEGNVWLFYVDELDAYLDRQRPATANEYPFPSGSKGFDHDSIN